MSTDIITPFAFNDNLLRTITDEKGDVWFVAKDVALALDYSESSITQLANLFGHIPDEWKGHNPIKVRSENGVVQERQVITLSEQGLYFFLGRSDKPKALPYQKWIAGDVMPTLRRTGTYTLPQAHQRVLPTDAFPPEAMSLRPVMRQRLWQDAMQAARLDNAGSDAAMQWFAKLCRLMGAHAAAPEQASSVQHFVAKGCVPDVGFRIASSTLWQCYVRFCTQTLGMDAQNCLSNKAFSSSLLLHPEVKCLRNRPTTIFTGLRPLQR